MAWGAAALSVLGILVKALPGPAQDNTVFILLFLPIWVGLALGFGQLTRRA